MNTSIKTTLIRFPFLSAITLAIATIFFQYLPRFFLPEISNFSQKFIGKTTIALLAIAAISILGWWRETKFVAPSHLKTWKIFLPLFILPVLSALVSEFHVTDPFQIAIFAFYVFIVGFAEESIVRGLFMRILQPLGIWQAVLFSSLIFGLMHFGNLLMGADLGSTLTQVLYAALIGIAFAGTFAAGESIWPLILIHALIDFFPKLNAPPSGDSSMDFSTALLLVGVQVPFALYGLWMLSRRIKSDSQNA